MESIGKINQEQLDRLVKIEKRKRAVNDLLQPLIEEQEKINEAYDVCMEQIRSEHKIESGFAVSHETGEITPLDGQE